MVIQVLPEAQEDLRDAASYCRALSPPTVGRGLASRVLRELNQALAAVESMPLARQEHPDIPGVRLVHLATFPLFAFYLVDGSNIVVVFVDVLGETEKPFIAANIC